MDDSQFEPEEATDTDQNLNDIIENIERKSSRINPAFKWMGIGRRGGINPAFKWMGLGKRSNLNSAFKWMGLGKRDGVSPAFKWMGLGKKSGISPAMKWMGLGKRDSVSPGLKWMGLGKRFESPVRYHYFWGSDSPDLNDISALNTEDLEYGGGDQLAKKGSGIKLYSRGATGRVDPAWGWGGLGR